MNPIYILLVEDNEGDILLIEEAFEQAGAMAKLNIVKNGKDAIDFLKHEGNFKNSEVPDLILLDINLPKKNGHEVLKYIKENKDLKHIPTIMLTTSSNQKDINKAYENYASCYITKPVEVTEYIKMIQLMHNFWVCTAKLPESHENR